MVVISAPIVSDPSILSKRTRSTFKIFPRNGSIAWVLRSRPCFAVPPAESPSTINSSHFAGSFSEQFANFPGNPPNSGPVFLRDNSRALRAASRAVAASIILSTINFAIAGFSSRYSYNKSYTVFSTNGLTSDETNLSLVCDPNFGSGIFTLIILVKPSRKSSPDRLMSFFVDFSPIYLLIARVSPARNPARCVPPSRFGILFVKHNDVSVYAVVHCKTISIYVSSICFIIWIGSRFNNSLDLSRYVANPFNPSAEWNSRVFFSGPRKSSRIILTFAFKNDCSRNHVSNVSKLNSVPVNVSGDGRKVTSVPCS